MFKMYASNLHSYTHLILALGIVREPTVWVFITSKYPGIHDVHWAGYSIHTRVALSAGAAGLAYLHAKGIAHRPAMFRRLTTRRQMTLYRIYAPE